MSSIVTRKGVIVSKQTIKVGTKSLLLTTHESDLSITLYIGGHNVYCIEAQLMKGETIGNFNKIQYNINCSLEHNFRRGYDTNMILKLLLTYIHKTYPSIELMRFNDASYRTCDNREVNLFEMSYITTGKTWYENNFEAFLEEADAKVFAKQNAAFQEKKKDISWDSMKDTMKDIRQSPYPIEESVLKGFYEDATTWQDFFTSLRNTLGQSAFCNFISPWLHTFITRHFKFPFTYAHYLLRVKDWDVAYELSEYQRGGRKYTRKHTKRMFDER